jgi:peptidyl-tRNA hydrolase
MAAKDGGGNQTAKPAAGQTATDALRTAPPLLQKNVAHYILVACSNENREIIRRYIDFVHASSKDKKREKCIIDVPAPRDILTGLKRAKEILEEQHLDTARVLIDVPSGKERDVLDWIQQNIPETEQNWITIITRNPDVFPRKIETIHVDTKREIGGGSILGTG